MSAQQPTERPQPPKSEGYRHGGTAPSSKPTITMSMSPHYTLPTSKAGTPLNSAPGTPVRGTLPSLSSLSSLSVSGGYPFPPRGPIRMLSEHAVSDTPLTSDPYGAPSASASGGDYMSYRHPTNAQSQLPTAELRSNLAATAATSTAAAMGTAAMGASGAGAWGSSRGIIGGSGPANPREARETQYVSLSGSRNNSSTALSGMVGSSSRSHPLARGENLQQQSEVHHTEGEQMAPYGEGEVARAVEGAQAQARKRNTNTKRRESMAQGGKKPNLSLAHLGEGGEGEGGKEGQGEAGSDHHGRERMGSASQREASGERHGRVRGEVSLEPSEADLER